MGDIRRLCLSAEEGGARGKNWCQIREGFACQADELEPHFAGNEELWVGFEPREQS